ncbi:Methionine synthase [Ruegeria sp. THAF57]|nr:Methionine synthase [Ruegeria sp. THAF57]
MNTPVLRLRQAFRKFRWELSILTKTRVPQPFLNEMQDVHAENDVELINNLPYRSVPEPPRSQSSQSNCDEMAKTEKMPPRAQCPNSSGKRPMSDEEDIVLSELNDDELVEQMFDDLYDGLKEEIEEGVNILLERGWTPYDILTKALVGGMTIVGHDFRDGILFVPEVLLAANAMKGGMAILKPLLAETGAPRVGKMVIGTVKGDIHDIGKNLVSMMMEGAGFDVVDIGINNPVENYLEALETEKPDILGMSALLTTTMPYMKVVIDTMVEQGLREEYIVLVGGAPLNEEFGKAIGADGYCRDAAVAVEMAKDFVSRKHNQLAG